MNGNLLNRVPALLSFVIFLTCFGVKAVSAQSITSSSPQTQVNPNLNQSNQIDISGGIRSGGNLFHSFGHFGLNAGQIANFQSNPNIQNILGRVTGGNASIINGTLQVTGGPSNLFLLNPAGIIFGQNAQLNVPASFTASTANGISFGNNQWFNAIGNNNYANLTSNPSSYGFANGTGGSIINSGNLAVAQGQSLTLLGGTVINTGTLTAPGGTITIAAVPGQRMVRLTDSNSPLSIDLPLDPNAAINPTSFTPQSLPALLTGGGLANATGLTVENGVVSLTATQTPIVPGSLTLAGRVNANAGTTGNGGSIFANSNKTLIAANLSAEGGSASGNGGFIETSGQSLTVAPSTTVSTRAPKGAFGTWLLDPANIQIVASGGTSNSIADANASVADTTIDAGTIVTALNNGNVNLQATNSITVNAGINSSGNANPGDLALTAPTTNLNAPIALRTVSVLTGTATTVNVGATGTVQNGVDAAATGGTVNLAAATYTLAQEVGINKDITIRGVAANQTTVSGNNAVRVFNVGSGNVTLDSMSIVNGNAAFGAGIINSNSGILTLKDSTIANNFASSTGGAIANSGTLTVVGSTISGNEALNNSGIYNTGTLTVRNSTLSGNKSTDGGGNGGAIFSSDSSRLTVENSTVTGNFAKNAGGGIDARGTTTIANSIIAGNTANDTSAIDTSIRGNFTSLGNNLVGQNGSAGGFQTIASDILVPGPIGNEIGPLANNGGTTQTHAVLPGRLAIDASGANATTTGQNGNPIAGNARDIGAYEFGGFQFNLTTVSGNNQSTMVNTAFQPLVVEVRPNIAGQPVAGGTIVAFTPATNNGAGIQNTAVQNVTIGTNNQASITPTANTVTGTHTVSANATGNTGTAQVFTLTNTPGAAATLTATGPGSLPAGQTTVVNTPFASALQVLVQDQYGNVIPGAMVNFAVPETGASGTLSTVTATTGTNGVASVNVIANTVAGGFGATGTLNGLSAQYSLTNLAGAATTVTGNGNQSTVINTGFANSLQATVTDQYGNPISNASVTFSVTPNNGASGTIATASAITNGNGVATTTVTANGTVGSYTATGSLPETTITPANYNLNNVANPASIPATIAVFGGSEQNTTVNTSFTNPLQVLVSNSTGAPLANTPVTFTLPGAIGTPASTLTVLTNANGIATLPVSALGTTGTFNPIATVNNLTTQFTLTNNAVAVIPVTPIDPVIPVTPIDPVTPVIPVTPINPVTPISPGNNGILTSIEQVRIGQSLRRSNPTIKSSLNPSGGGSSLLCATRDRNQEDEFERDEKGNVIRRKVRTNDRTKLNNSEIQGLPDCSRSDENLNTGTKTTGTK